MRVFVAIDLPTDIRSELVSLQNSIVLGRRVPAENLHLTLSFLGEQNDLKLEEAHEDLSTINVPAFDLQLCSIGTFGTRSPRVIFADVIRCDGLLDLERRVNRALRHAGLEFKKRRFRPHVTLARLPQFVSEHALAELRDFLDAHASFLGSSFRVSSFQLYQSTLLPRGAVHKILASYLLSGAQT